jgi:hypothetical protein
MGGPLAKHRPAPKRLCAASYRVGKQVPPGNNNHRDMTLSQCNKSAELHAPLGRTRRRAP